MKYTLDLSSKKYICPKCYKKSFVVILDENKKVVNDKVFGRCDREDKCGYFVRPADDGSESTVDYQNNKERKVLSKYAFLPSDVNKYVDNYEKNNLFNYICTKFSSDKVADIFQMYRVGVYTGISNFDWVLFWQMDSKPWIRTAKMIRYTASGKRDKSGSPIWYHSLEQNKKEDHEPSQCLFGYHLKDLGKPIAVVESEKTALICALFIPNYTWMATGGKSNFRLFSGLKGCDVTLFPDLGAFKVWSDEGLKYGFKVSDYLERIATQEDRDNGYDLADFLMR